jgi:sulfopyruvate decarboxylase TPP-binding subunit
MEDIKEINTEIPEGKLLMAALAIITTESRTDKTPYEVLEIITKLSKEMYP